MSRWIERYIAGAHEHVWAEMTSMGDKLREEPYWSEAIEVARETMRRARTNVERLIELLPTTGFEFEIPSTSCSSRPAAT